MCISESHIFLKLKITNKVELFQFIVDTAYYYNIISDKKLIKELLYHRENQGSTILKNSLAFPHTMNNSIITLTPFIIQLEHPILYYPNQEVSTIFCILAPTTSKFYINLLSLLAEIALNKNLYSLIRNSHQTQNNLVSHEINSYLLNKKLIV